jgi:hypothetical protein
VTTTVPEIFGSFSFVVDTSTWILDPVTGFGSVRHQPLESFLVYPSPLGTTVFDTTNMELFMAQPG